MSNPFGGGYTNATIIYLVSDAIRVFAGAVPYVYDDTGNKVYLWQFATVKENGVTRFADVPELFQIARFVDNGRDYGTSQHKSALSGLKAYLAFAIAVYRQSANYDYQKAA